MEEKVFTSVDNKNEKNFKLHKKPNCIYLRGKSSSGEKN